MKYPALRFVSFFIRLIGWLLLIAGAIATLILVGAMTGISDQLGIHIPLYLPMFAPISLGTLLSGLWFLAFGELVKVFVDIALNTSQLVTLAREGRTTK